MDYMAKKDTKRAEVEPVEEKVSYEVVAEFKDLEDGGKVYKPGNTYPNPPNKKVSDERIKQLSTNANTHGKKFIKAK